MVHRQSLKGPHGPDVSKGLHVRTCQLRAAGHYFDLHQACRCIQPAALYKQLSVAVSVLDRRYDVDLKGIMADAK